MKLNNYASQNYRLTVTRLNFLSLVSIYRVDIVVQNSFRPSTTQSISFTDLLGEQMIDRLIYMCEFVFFFSPLVAFSPSVLGLPPNSYRLQSRLAYLQHLALQSQVVHFSDQLDIHDLKFVFSACNGLDL